MNKKLLHLSRWLFTIITLLSFGIGQMWGAVNDVVTSVNPTADLGADQSYDAASNDYWAVNVTNSTAFGTNAKSSNDGKLKLSNNSDVSTRNTAIATALATYTEAEFTVNTQYVAALIGLTNLSNVGKVGVTYGGTNGGAPDDMWVLYSTNSGSTYSVAGHASSVSSGTNITFTSTISSAQYAVVFKRSAAFGIKSTPTITFYEGATTTSFTITAQSNNNSYGTVSLSGSIITGAPTNGYRYANPAYTVSPANSATVAQNGNEFTVNPSENTTVTINFEVIPSHTVTWSANGNTSNTSSVKEGDAIEFPNTATGCTGGTFVGWTASPIDGTSDEAPTYVTSAIMSTSDITYYAVFADEEEGGDAEWVETALSDLTSSDVFVLSTGSYALNNDNGTSSAPSANSITVSNGKITSTVADKLKWNISGNATDGYVFYPNGSTTTWLYCNTTATSSSNNNIRVGSGDRKLWKPNDSGYLVTNDNNTARYLSLYNNSDFRGYTGTSNGAFVPKCYKSVVGVTYSNYRTTCCTPLGSINGSFLLHQLNGRFFCSFSS